MIIALCLPQQVAMLSSGLGDSVPYNPVGEKITKLETSNPATAGTGRF